METFVQRRDGITLRNLNLTPEGYLNTRGVVAKEGILTYYRDGKPFREYVPAETLKEAQHLDSLQGIPVTRRHPSLGEVDADNAKAEMRGVTLGAATVVNDGEDTLVETGVKLFDKAVIADVQAGVVELSLGYKARLDMKPGTWRGQAYDAIQVKRVNNHLALVESARAGHKARLRLDSTHNLIEEEGMELVTIKIDGKDIQVPKDSAGAIEAGLRAAATRADAGAGQAAELAELRKKMDATQAELDVLKSEKAKNDSAEAKANEQKRIDALVKERAELLTKAQAHLKADQVTKLDGLDNLSLMRAVAEALDPETKLDGKSEDYVRAHFDALLKYRGNGEGGSKRADAKGGPSLGEQIVHGPKGGLRTDAAGQGANVVLSSQALQFARKGLANLHRVSLAKA
jgi:hypothetical protein